MSYSHSVITELRRKMSGGFETPVKLGAEQRFVKAMPNSHNNNLEEQNIMGVDNIMSFWTNENVKYVTTKFFDGDITHVTNNGYYILFEQDYHEKKVPSDFYFSESSLFLPEYSKSGANFKLEKIDEKGNRIYSLVLDDPENYSELSRMYTYDSANNTLEINPDFQIIKHDFLCFRVDLSNNSDTRIKSDILISEKITSKRIEDSGKTIVKSQIINYLE